MGSFLTTFEELTHILDFLVFRHGNDNVLQCES